MLLCVHRRLSHMSGPGCSSACRQGQSTPWGKPCTLAQLCTVLEHVKAGTKHECCIPCLDSCMARSTQHPEQEWGTPRVRRARKHTPPRPTQHTHSHSETSPRQAHAPATPEPPAPHPNSHRTGGAAHATTPVPKRRAHPESSGTASAAAAPNPSAAPHTLPAAGRLDQSSSIRC